MPQQGSADRPNHDQDIASAIPKECFDWTLAFWKRRDLPSCSGIGLKSLAMEIANRAIFELRLPHIVLSRMRRSMFPKRQSPALIKLPTAEADSPTLYELLQQSLEALSTALRDE